jgi:hypothetical protein
VRRCSSSCMLGFGLVLVLALALLIWGIVLMAADPSERLVFALGWASVVAALGLWCLGGLLSSSRREIGVQVEGLLSPVNERLQHISVLLNQVSEQQLISERAKAIAFREKEREALRRAIREDMAQKDWDAAVILANEIETVFGYAQEADQFRAEIQSQRNAEVRRLVADGAEVIDRYCKAEAWTQAMREAERLARMFPFDDQAVRLVQEVENRRQLLKEQLLTNWNDAVTRHDVDGSIDILKRLDLYLTPEEATGMQDTARQVFKDKLLMLGQQFTLAVKHHNWQDAIRLGETISSEFPNSRMAVEVREKMDLLKQRATELALPRV